jgi:hypothetical protein
MNPLQLTWVEEPWTDDLNVHVETDETCIEYLPVHHRDSPGAVDADGIRPILVIG